MTAGASAGAVVVVGVRVRYRAEPSAVGLVTGVSGEGGYVSVFVDGSVRLVPVAELEPVPAFREMSVGDFRAELTRRRLENPVTDQYLSYGASDTRLYYHQFLPVKKMLESPHQRLLIADEVGTGKTIEAGLIWAELESRAAHGLGNVWIVCPKSLTGKWRDEMAQRFDFRLEVLSPDGLRGALASLRRDGVLSPGFSKCIVNLELIRMTDHAAGLAESPVEWDLTVFDEAHHLRNTATLSHSLAEFMCQRSKAAVLLTATPLQTGLEDLVHLMQALGVDIAADPRSLDEQIRWDMRLNDWIRLVRRRPPGWEQTAVEQLEALAGSGGRGRHGWDVLHRLVTQGCLHRRAERSVVIDTARDMQALSPYMTRTCRADVEQDRPTREAITKIVQFSREEKALYGRRVRGLPPTGCYERPPAGFHHPDAGAPHRELRPRGGSGDIAALLRIRTRPAPGRVHPRGSQRPAAPGRSGDRFRGPQARSTV